MLKISLTEKWDDDFFKKWKSLYSAIYDPKKYLNEDLESLKIILNPISFPEEQWKAFLIEDEGKIVARALLTINSKNPHLCKVGYFEFLEKEEPLQFLWNEIEKVAKNLGAKEIKAPINMNFFVGYRLRLWTKNDHFYSEPKEPLYYQKFYEKLGLNLCKTWETFNLDKSKTPQNFSAIRKKNKPGVKLTIRNINMKDFETDLKMVYDLFIDTYQLMTEYETISFETFFQLYESFRYLIHPYFSYLVFDGNKPVGFCINFFDPQDLLLKFQNKTPNAFNKAWLLFRLKTNFRRLLIMYVGRYPGDEYKGVQSMVSKRLAIMYFFCRLKEAYVCFTAEDSPAKKSFNMNDHEIIARYGLFKKIL